MVLNNTKRFSEQGITYQISLSPKCYIIQIYAVATVPLITKTFIVKYYDRRI